MLCSLTSVFACDPKPPKVIANCDDINWTTWTSFNGTNAVGTVNDGFSDVNVTMTSNFNFDSSPGIYTHSKFNAYPSPVPNRTVPRTEWSKGAGGTTQMCFSKTVNNPVLLIASLGNSAGLRATLNFSLPYVVLFDGGNMEFNNSTTITGTEGYAIIIFPGEFDCVTINSTTPEYYTNITWGIRPPPFLINITETGGDCQNLILTASGGIKYEWNGGDTPNSATNTFHRSGRYIVTVTDANGCKTSTSKDIDVTLPPNIVVNGSDSGCGSVILTVSGGTSYLWDGGESPNSASNTFLTSGTYTVTVTNAAGCISTATKVITVYPVLNSSVVIDSDKNGSVCEGTEITFSARGIDEGKSSTFKWFKNNNLVGSGVTYKTSDLTNSDEVRCEMTSEDYCAVSHSVTSNIIKLAINSKPIILINQNATIDDTGTVQLDPSVTGNIIEYAWSPASGLDNPTIRNPIASPEKTTRYRLRVTTIDGCETFAEVLVSVINDFKLPTVFSPNGDGVNDLWNISELSAYLKSRITVFNRYGEPIFRSEGNHSSWDGTFKGQLVPAGVYYYVILLNYEDMNPITGSISVLR